VNERRTELYDAESEGVWSQQPRFADRITFLSDDDGAHRLLVDGVELPYFIATHEDNPILVNGRPYDEFEPGWAFDLDAGLGATDVGRVTITLLAPRVEFRRSRFPLRRQDT
jgi:hypothetical protein